MVSEGNGFIPYPQRFERNATDTPEGGENMASKQQVNAANAAVAAGTANGNQAALVARSAKGVGAAANQSKAAMKAAGKK
jgi:hypothetical protein